MYWDSENVQWNTNSWVQKCIFKRVNYLVLCLTEYKATAEAIYDRFINVHIINQVIKPLIRENDNWSHTAIITLLRIQSAANIFLIKVLSEYHDLKTKLMQMEDDFVERIQIESGIQDPEELASVLIKWFMENDIHHYIMLTKKKRRSNNKSIATLLLLRAKRNLKGNQYTSWYWRSGNRYAS